MKNLLIIILILTLKTSYSQTLESVWGVPMGITYDSAKTLIKSKYKGTLEYRPNVIFIMHPKFGGYNESEAIQFYFNEDKRLCKVIVLFKPQINELFVFFDKIKDDLTEKYGKCSKNEEVFLYPFDTDYRKYPMFIEKYLETFYSRWVLESKFNSTEGTVIMLILNNDNRVGIVYNDLALSSKMTEKEKQNKLNDY